ncbi:MAG: ComEC/Rec2 family competence protein [Clostridium sp.]
MKKKIIGFILVLLVVISIPFLPLPNIDNVLPAQSSNISSEESINTNMRVHYIDVGQGDSILLTVNNKTMLIDAGPRSDEDKLLNYLSSQNITKLDYVIATHPHEDHIGNMDEVIKKYDIGTFYAPKKTATSKTYESMIQALLDKGKQITVIKEGTSSIDLGENTRVTVYSPTKDEYEDVNNFSPIIKIEYGENSFMFTGDAEDVVEKEVLSKNASLKSDVLKLGHHGSKSSTTEGFYKAVDPSIAVISCGRDNKYNHPSKETKDLLRKYRPKTFRTDLDGTIVLESNGKEIFRH